MTKYELNELRQINEFLSRNIVHDDENYDMRIKSINYNMQTKEYVANFEAIKTVIIDGTELERGIDEVVYEIV